ncbi:MAG: hypothetical protein ACO1QB_03790 [Verrucomicrobiales bacterium]
MNLLKTIRGVRVKLYNPETIAYRDRIISNGGSIAETSLDAIEKFVIDCKNASIWDKFLEVGPFAGTGLNAALVKLVYPGGGSGVLTNVNFVSGDYVETGTNGGLLGDGATKYLNTGFNLQTSLPDNAHFSACMRDDVGVAGNRSMIGAVSGSDQYWMGSVTPASSMACRMGQLATASMGQAMLRGFYAAVRSTSNQLRFYKDGIMTGSDSSAVAHTKPNQPIYLFAFNSAGTPGAFLPSRLSFYSIGEPLNEQETAALHDAVRTLQRNLNRSIN